jgi:hypothetical protein
MLSIYSPMAMLAGMQLDVFTPLKDGAMTAAELARALGLPAEKLEIPSLLTGPCCAAHSRRGVLCEYP